MTRRYDSSVDYCHDVREMIEQLPQVKRRDSGASAMQGFFTVEEKEAIKKLCDRRGWDASHYIRCSALHCLQHELQDLSND
ncbi:MAG: hypothetical protein HC815_04100 [Richelia sp. RM1_1_1]|nr:hypothetical protein [Richelia sp. RM1_1_1]